MRRDEPVTRKRRKGPKPKQAIQRGPTSEKKKSPKESTGTKTGSTKPEGTKRGETEGQGERYPEGRNPEPRKETAKHLMEETEEWQMTGEVKATNNQGRPNEKKNAEKMT